MDRIPVVSSNLATIGYDAEHRLLEVEFKNGAVWRYADVPPEEHEALMTAPSVGRYFAANIKPVYADAEQV